MISSSSDFHLLSLVSLQLTARTKNIQSCGFFSSTRLQSAARPLSRSLGLSTLARQSEMQLWFEMWSGKEMKRVPWFWEVFVVRIGWVWRWFTYGIGENGIGQFGRWWKCCQKGCLAVHGDGCGVVGIVKGILVFSLLFLISTQDLSSNLIPKFIPKYNLIA